MPTTLELRIIINRETIMAKQPADFTIAIHPGDILQEMLDERGLTQMFLARHLSTDVARINEICRRRRGISAPRAVMLAKALDTSPGWWLNLQKNWELSQVDSHAARHVRPLKKSA